MWMCSLIVIWSTERRVRAHGRTCSSILVDAGTQQHLFLRIKFIRTFSTCRCTIWWSFAHRAPWDSLEIKFTGNVFACSCVPSCSFAYQDHTGVFTGILCVFGTQLPLAGFIPNQVHWNCNIGILEYLRAPGILGCNPILESQPTTTLCWYIFCYMFLSQHAHAMPQLLTSWCHCKTTRSC